MKIQLKTIKKQLSKLSFGSSHDTDNVWVRGQICE